VGQMAAADRAEHPSWARMRPARERLVLFGGEAVLKGEEADSSFDWERTLNMAQRAHSERSEALLEAFSAEILASFSVPAAAVGLPGQLAKQPVASVRPGFGQRQDVLVRAFAGLCTRAQAEFPTLRTLTDL